MIKLQKILCPVDFSETSELARREACCLAKQFGAELHVIHVIRNLLHDPPQFGMGLDAPFTLKSSSGSEDLEASALSHLADLMDAECEAGFQPKLSVLWGQPYQEILEYAKNHDIDLIVMGSHGRTGLPRALLGSVAERVIRLAPCPVLTVKSPAKE